MIETILLGLNPYYNGRYSTRISTKAKTVFCLIVLILIIMEDTLRVNAMDVTVFVILVLILIIMEDTLREQKLQSITNQHINLAPKIKFCIFPLKRHYF